MAICRACACYMSHKTVGLAKPCKHTSHGRQARLRRFMSGRHPEPGFKEYYIENVVHLRSGEFNLFRSGNARGSGEPPADEVHQAANADAGGDAALASADLQQPAASQEDWQSSALFDPALMEAQLHPCVMQHGAEEEEDDGLFDDDEGMGLPAYY